MKTKKEFHKVRQGVKEVQTYQDGFKVFHNYIRKAVKDKKTPAERVGLMVNNSNRWIGMLNESVMKYNLEKIKLEKEIKCYA